MVTVYPNQIDTSGTLPVAVDNSTPVTADIFNQLRSAILAIESELGTHPSTSYTTVRNRLDTHETLINQLLNLPAGGIAFSGDLSGNALSQTVIGLQGHPVSPTVPSTGQVLTWGGSTWSPQNAASTISTVQNGYNYGSYTLVPVFPGITATNSNTFVTAGTFELDPTKLTAANGIRTIELRCVAHTTAPQITIQLYNYTAASVVASSTLTTSSTTPALLSTGDLSSNLTNGSAIYQVQIEMVSGSSTDQVTLDMAYLKIAWA